MSNASAWGSLRKRNLTALLFAIRDSPGLSQGDLVRQVGLAGGAVSSLANELIDARLVTATTSNQPVHGRPRQQLYLDDAMPLLVGIRISRWSIDLRIATLAGRVLESATRTVYRPSPRSAGVVVEEMIAVAQSLPSPNASVVISIPGRVLEHRIGSEELDWLEYPIADLVGPLAHRFERAVQVVNDAKLATIAERRTGQAGPAVVVMIGAGIGGGVAGEFPVALGSDSARGLGHVPVEPNGPRCGCGRFGCVELYASLSGFARQLGEEIQLAEEGPAWFSKALFDRASAGDAAVLAVLEGARTSLSRFGELMVAVVEPDTIIYTGEGSVLLRWISSNEVGIPPVPVVEGKHGGSAVIEGALLQAQWGLIERPIL